MSNKEDEKRADEMSEPHEEAWDDLLGRADSELELATEDTYLDAYSPRSELEGERQILGFWLGKEEYALDLLEVNEILRWRPCTPVPRTRDFVLGVISVRGDVLPVIDLRKRLGLEGDGAVEACRVLVVGKESERFGLLVDSVSGVTRLAADQIEPTPPMMSRQEADFVAGIGRAGPRMLILIQLEAVLDFEAAIQEETT
jgi:purine-binding chemotaxis protein CheW